MNTPALKPLATVAVLLSVSALLPAQTLLNIDFGVGSASAKSGSAATGLSTNDFWNLYSHYGARFAPGTTLVPHGRLEGLRYADGSASPVSISLSNAPGVWGNTSGDPMYDSYLFAPNGSNIVATLQGLAAGSYYLYLYGHADPDIGGEFNSAFTIKIGTNTFGPLVAAGSGVWKTNTAMREYGQYVVFRDLFVPGSMPVTIEAAPGPNGIAVLNGLQILSRGTSPPRLTKPPALLAATNPIDPRLTNLIFREVRYSGRVSDQEARFAVTIEADSYVTNEVSGALFEGDVALKPTRLPEGVRVVGSGRDSRLFLGSPGRYTCQFELVARITRQEPWNQVSFSGPAAAIASVEAEAQSPGVEIQLLNGTQVEQGKASRVTGSIGADRKLSLRWQSKSAEVRRKALLTVDTAANALVKPTGVEYTTVLRYEILQAAAPRLTLELPASQTLTRLQGPQIRDWQVAPEGTRRILTVDFIKPVEKGCELTLVSEQNLTAAATAMAFELPVPLDVQRHAGTITVAAEEVSVEIDAPPTLRQINAPSGALAAYRFTSGLTPLPARVKRLEPVLKVHDRVAARMEEARLLVLHTLSMTVEKSGLYALDLTVPPGFLVSAVRGENIEDWKASGAAEAGQKVHVGFSARLMGARKLEVELEQPLKTFPGSIAIAALGIAGATNETAQVGVAAALGIRLRTAGDAPGMREIPVTVLERRGDELLAFAADQSGWKLNLLPEKLSARVVAEVFNLVTIGDGLVGGSATIRYGIFNQGAQEFRVALPAHWRNVEFTGSNIRRKEQQTNVWTITLQDKAWGGYTLVITYDYQFDPKTATLDLAGAHPLEVERETGSLGLMTAASLKLTAAAPAVPMRRVDEGELSENDRALCTRPLLLAYRYTGTNYAHSVQVARFDEQRVLEAVADRIELTTVVTEEGQMLTQAGFMVKNNDKQFQQFKLPKDAEFWSSHVNNQPAKPERDGDWLLVPLPRDANRDQAFAVDIVYAQKTSLKSGLLPRRVGLAAPMTDIPNTYAEWQLFLPVSRRLGGFAGNMTVARGATYELRDAWQEFLQFYGGLMERHAGSILLCVLAGAAIALIVAASKRGFQGALTVIALFAILAILGGMMLPALARAKAKATRMNAVSNLKQIGLAARIWANDNGEYLPPSFEAMKVELNSDKILIDPSSGLRFVYVGAGKKADDPNAIVAYSPSDLNGRAVAFADGSVQQMTPEKFQEALQRDAAVPRTVVASAPAQPAALQTPGPAPAMPAPIAQAAKPATAGVRPIRIDVPRTGQVFNFTKVLNAGKEPLAIELSVMRLKTYRNLMMVFQVAGFLSGLCMLWLLMRRASPSSFWMTVALSLIVVSVSSLLYMWRLLGAGLILLVPALVFALLGWLGWQWAQRRKAAAASSSSTLSPVPPTASGGPAAATALIAFLAALTAAQNASGQSPASGASPDANAVSILSAVYQGRIGERVAQFDATLELISAGTNQLVPLFGEDVAMKAFTNSGDAKLLRQGNSVGVLLPSRTNVTLQFTVIARLTGDVSRRTLAFGIPPALSSRVNVAIDEADADVEFPSAVAFQRTNATNQTRVEAILGASDRLEMNWTPRVKRAAEIAATVFCQNNALATLGGGVLNVRALLDYQISQGEIKQARVALPAGHRMLRLEGDSIRTWEVKDDQVTVELLKGVSTHYRLTVETEKPLPALPGSTRVEIPHALGVKRETGLLALRGGEDLTLNTEEARDLQRVDAEEFQRSGSERKEGLASVFRFLKPDFGLAVRAEPVQPQIDAVVRHQVRIGTEAVRVQSQVDYTIKRAGIFLLRLATPADYRIENVSGSNVLQWTTRTEGGRLVTEVALKERAMGSHTLGVSLARNYREPPASLPLAGAHPLDTQKLSGFVTVTSEPGIAAKTTAFEGLTEIPFASVPTERGGGGGSALAFKFIAAQPAAQASWKLTTATEAVEPWVRAEVGNTITVTETLLSGRAILKYDVANAPVKEFRLRVPSSFKNVEINGAQIRRRDQNGEEWRVELQGKVRGDYPLTVTWEMPKSEKTNLVELGGVQALGVERETGWLAWIARPPIQVADKSAGELLSRIDVQELPEWMGRADPGTVLALRYLRPGYRAAIEARRYDEAKVLEAIVESARLATVVADDGQMMTTVSLTLRNNGRQHLEVELPEKATLWSAFVAGDPVRPSLREGRLLVPLDRTSASEAPLAIDLTFVGTERFPRSRGFLGLQSPKFDVPLKNAHWELFLPPDYDYSQFEGSMSRTIEVASLPLVQAYSLAEYNVQQRAVEEQNKKEVKNDLKMVRENIKGNLRQAMTTYNRAKSRGQQFKQEVADDRDLKQIERDVRLEQGRNLIAAQNAYFFENAGKLSDQAQVPVVNAPAQAAEAQPQGRPSQSMNAFLNYDAEVAGQQWDKLEKAQQVAAPKVAPLRVNLPTRGAHLAFSQVLQTELRKPMTIRLRAENTKEPSWPSRFALAGVAFLALWAVVANFNRRRQAA